MAFTHDASTDEGLLRTLLNDTDSTDYEFEDAELTATLDLNSGDLWNTAADLARALGAKYSKEAIKLGLGKGDITIDKTKKAQFYMSLADRFDQRSGSDAVEYVDSLNVRVDRFGFDRSEYIGDD